MRFGGPTELRKYLVVIQLTLLLTSVLAVTSYATTASVTGTGFQAQFGQSYDVTTYFAVHGGDFIVSIPRSASASPCSWSDGGVCNTAIAGGNYAYSVGLTINTVPSSTRTYTLDVEWAQSGGSLQVQMCQLAFTVSPLASNGQTMAFACDTGGSTLSTPIAILVTVA